MKYLTIGLGIACLVLTLATIAAAKWAQTETTKRATVEGQFSAFKHNVKITGENAEKAAKKQEAADKAKQEKADAENKRDRDGLLATIGRLRSERGNPSGGSLSASPAGSRCPQGQVCYDLTEYQRAWGEFLASVRGLFDEGSQVAVDLETAKRWAQSQ